MKKKDVFWKIGGQSVISKFSVKKPYTVVVAIILIIL